MLFWCHIIGEHGFVCGVVGLGEHVEADEVEAVYARPAHTCDSAERERVTVFGDLFEQLVVDVGDEVSDRLLRQRTLDLHVEPLALAYAIVHRHAHLLARAVHRYRLEQTKRTKRLFGFPAIVQQTKGQMK